MGRVLELKYGNTNTYLIKGRDKYLLFDTDWAGTFEPFCKAIKAQGVQIKDIGYLFISHMHPDHMGLAGQLAKLGVQIAAAPFQMGLLHQSDEIFEKEGNRAFVPIEEANVLELALEQSRSFLQEIGIEGEIVHTPGHSEDSISIWLDEGSLLVGDLNPLYELSLHEGTQIGDTWKELLKRNPKKVYYGHAKPAVLEKSGETRQEQSRGGEERYRLVSAIMKYTDRNLSIDKIQKKTGADRDYIENVMRMYLTHQNVSVQGILDRIENRRNHIAGNIL